MTYDHWKCTDPTELGSTHMDRQHRGTDTEPERHEASARNRRKMLHQAEVIADELRFLLIELTEREVNVKYALSKTLKMLNRMKMEFKNDPPVT